MSVHTSRCVAVFTAAVATVCLVVAIARAPRRQPSVVITAQNKSAYKACVATDKLVLFLDASLSIEAAASRPQFRKMAHNTDRSKNVRFVILNFDEELMTPFWQQMNEWFRSQSVQELGYRGYGKTLWVLNGSVVHCEYRIYDKSIADLSNLTNRHLLNDETGHITK